MVKDDRYYVVGHTKDGEIQGVGCETLKPFTFEAAQRMVRCHRKYRGTMIRTPIMFKLVKVNPETGEEE